MSDFASLLIDARTRVGLSQSQLAAAAGLTPSYLCFIEKRKKPPPSDEVCLRLAEVLQLPAEKLIEVAHLERAPEPLRRRLKNLDQTVQRERRSRLRTLKSLLSPFLFAGPPGFAESALETVGISEARRRRIREVLHAVGRKHQDQEKAVSRLVDELPERERSALLEALPGMLGSAQTPAQPELKSDPPEASASPTPFLIAATAQMASGIDEVRAGDLLLVDPAEPSRDGDLVLLRIGNDAGLERRGKGEPEGSVGTVVEIRRPLRRREA